jgi:hypothetical protein
MITIDLFQSPSSRTWWWRAESCKLVRGPFPDRAAADADAIATAHDLIAVLATDDEAEGASYCEVARQGEAVGRDGRAGRLLP